MRHTKNEITIEYRKGLVKSTNPDLIEYGGRH